MSVPIKRIACSSKFFGAPLIPAASRCSEIFACASAGVFTPPHLVERIHIEW